MVRLCVGCEFGRRMFEIVGSVGVLLTCTNEVSPMQDMVFTEERRGCYLWKCAACARESSSDDFNTCTCSSREAKASPVAPVAPAGMDVLAMKAAGQCLVDLTRKYQLFLGSSLAISKRDGYAILHALEEWDSAVHKP